MTCLKTYHWASTIRCTGTSLKIFNLIKVSYSPSFLDLSINKMINKEKWRERKRLNLFSHPCLLSCQPFFLGFDWNSSCLNLFLEDLPKMGFMLPLSCIWKSYMPSYMNKRLVLGYAFHNLILHLIILWYLWDKWTSNIKLCSYCAMSGKSSNAAKFISLSRSVVL